jgi:hypothetical protein
VQQLAPLQLGSIREQRLEQLMHDAEGKVTLQLSTTCTENAHSAICGNLARSREQRRLAYPCRTLDDDQAPETGSGLGERRLNTRKLVTPFDQLFVRRAHSLAQA